ncbi:contractile injection system protein, VgrG/Pvc8 family [Mixta calida]|uniref:contractile injection system protein, VgrG/Pvc8 family n=1 Tax=Mixta calida TaxID=665913 RepID=UPI002909B83D|nr:contractile injection system protein, VgrG/Pvc8 family [Mixta calida]MDU6416623.1 contractile injection system protein, VgrG/Pvc8 family [Mixta calida]
MVKEIAARHKLDPALGEDMAKMAIDHLDQTNESDASFLMRLARQCGALACVKNGKLLFIRQGQGRTASGKFLPVITLTRSAGDSHRFTLADRDAYTGVIASWLHTREPAKKEARRGNVLHSAGAGAGRSLYRDAGEGQRVQAADRRQQLDHHHADAHVERRQRVYHQH